MSRGTSLYKLIQLKTVYLKEGNEAKPLIDTCSILNFFFLCVSQVVNNLWLTNILCLRLGNQTDGDEEFTERVPHRVSSRVI